MDNMNTSSASEGDREGNLAPVVDGSSQILLAGTATEGKNYKNAPYGCGVAEVLHGTKEKQQAEIKKLAQEQHNKMKEHLMIVEEIVEKAISPSWRRSKQVRELLSLVKEVRDMLEQFGNENFQLVENNGIEMKKNLNESFNQVMH